MAKPLRSILDENETIKNALTVKNIILSDEHNAQFKNLKYT